MEVGIIAVPIVFSSICWVVTVIATNIRRGVNARAVAALHARVLDKCSSSQELIAYLESPAGRRFLESTVAESTNPAGHILLAIRLGFILTLAGVAEFAARTAGFPLDGDRSLVLTGAIATAVGIGFLCSAAASFVLCRSWGILKPQELTR